MGSRLYTGNLAWDTNEESLQSFLESDGRGVKEVFIVTDRETGRPRGFAFAEMSNDADAQSAISELDGVELDGRSLRINEARERQPGGGGDRW